VRFEAQSPRLDTRKRTPSDHLGIPCDFEEGGKRENGTKDCTEIYLQEGGGPLPAGAEPGGVLEGSSKKRLPGRGKRIVRDWPGGFLKYMEAMPERGGGGGRGTVPE